MTMYDIGIGITTHNRKEMCIDTVERIRSMSPKSTHIIVVDDASQDPPPSDHRFNQNVGITEAKNMCLKKLRHHEHIFLFDDDCYPTSKRWYVPYVTSPYPHLCYTFPTFVDGKGTGNTTIKTENGHTWYQHACGCMIYIRKSVLDVVGGYDHRFGLYGHEHINFSKRVHKAGLIPHPFIDVEKPMFYSYDQQKNVEHSIPFRVRRRSLRRNKNLTIDKIKHPL